MPRVKRKYDLYDENNNLIMRASINAISEYIGAPSKSLYRYIDTGARVHHTWLICDEGEYEKVEKSEPEEAQADDVVVNFPQKFIREYTQEWNRMAQQFGRVKWVKEGGKRLRCLD